MYPVLILRSEFVCLVILVFLVFISKAYNITKESKSFRRILTFAIVHVVFDILTVLTVNNQEVVPAWFNWTAHVIFYISAILYSYELAAYVVQICYKNVSEKLYAVGHAITAIYICCLSFLRIDYVKDNGTYSSAGPAAVVGYGVAFLFFFAALIIIFTHMNQMSTSIKGALIPMMLILMIAEICQIIWKSVLFTGGAVTIVTVGFFFSLENPVEVFRKKAMTDVLTGVQSRSSYEDDIEKLDKEFIRNPGPDYTFAFCDINDLRSVNNRFGHGEGDNYIILIASFLNECMKSSRAVYRIGGDEFLILYHKVSEDVVKEELQKLCVACEKASKDLKYIASVALGYAISSNEYKSLRDVIKSADYAMYQNKARVKAGINAEIGLGAKLNYAGLTDSLFGAMCASNDRTYPFITNLDTNVTRISPKWKEYFGLEDEFYNDFLGMWKDRIHKDYFEGYMKDVVATINGHQKYHNFDYLAKRSDGKYVMVSCHGSMYVDSNSGITYFAGYIVNHGLDDNIDPVTGLMNFDVLTSYVSKKMDEGQPFSILKLKLVNFARVNMLYGYDTGNEVIRNISKLLARETEGFGKIFCQASLNFSILLDHNDKAILEDLYKTLYETLLSGISSRSGIVPVLIAGGAYINNGERVPQERVRGGLVFAVEESMYSQRNSLVFYNDEENEDRSGADVDLLARIHANALENMDHFYLKYQPIVDVNSEKVVGAEALIRYKDVEYGEIPPDKFISFLENDPCYYRLGLWILDQAVKDAKKIKEKIPQFKINVNITAVQLQYHGFLDDVLRIIYENDYSPEGLVLELTERCKEMDGNFLAEKISDIRDKNIQVAFDDLGTGYSTINLLMNIPVDEIKLDKDFVRQLSDKETYQVFVRALASGSSVSGNRFTICFEGIEDQETLAMVRLFGSYLAQGYYFSKPLFIEDFAHYIDSNRGISEEKKDMVWLI